MEGISTEAASLAGHWGLGKLIVLYDDNKISIDGHTDISFTEDVSARFDALGWHTQHVADGNTDLDAIRKAIETAKSVTDKPSMIKVSTLIGYGSPNKADSHDVHGEFFSSSSSSSSGGSSDNDERKESSSKLTLSLSFFFSPILPRSISSPSRCPPRQGRDRRHAREPRLEVRRVRGA